MEELKKFDEILVADERQKHFVFPDPISGYRKLELKDVYEIAANIIKGNVLNCVQKILEIKKGHGKKVCVDQNTDLHPSGGNHDPWQEV